MNKEQRDKDIALLRELYIKLKEIMVTLYEVEERHPNAKHFREIMEEALGDINKADHLIIQDAHILKEEEDEVS